MNKNNFAFVEKFLLIIFYYFSLNSDIFRIIVDEDIIRYLKFFNFFIQGDPSYLAKINSPFRQQYYDNINKVIMPVESSFIGFIPLNNFFILNEKQGLEKIDDIYHVSFCNRVILIHFLNSFDMTPENVKIFLNFYFIIIYLFLLKIPEISNSFHLVNQMMVSEKQQENVRKNKRKKFLLN